ncbi:hypothetical protein RI367_007874 [Sorochytrium milnesiophthora]
MHPPVYELTYWSANYALRSAYANILVLGADNVKQTGPLFLCATHSNMICDPGLLIITTPHRRQNHYWAKNALWKHPVTRFIFNGLGAVPVDRAGGDNEALYRATVAMLERGEVMGVFPEGTSYTLPHITAFKDGMARAALQYALYARENQLPIAPIVPVGFNYSQKECWRSTVVVQYGKPVQVEPLLNEYIAEPKAAVKKLTSIMLDAVLNETINAPDWQSAYAATLARKLCIPPEYTDMTDFMTIFVDLAEHPLVKPCKEMLLQYHALLARHKLRDVDVVRHVRTVPSTQRLVIAAVMAVNQCLVQLPLVLPGAALHAPIHALVYYQTRREVFLECYGQAMGLTVLVTLPVLYFVYAAAAALFLGPFSQGWIMFMVALALVASTYQRFIDERLPAWCALGPTLRLAQLATTAEGRDVIKQLHDTRVECYHRLSRLFVAPEGSSSGNGSTAVQPVIFTEKRMQTNHRSASRSADDDDDADDNDTETVDDEDEQPQDDWSRRHRRISVPLLASPPTPQIQSPIAAAFDSSTSTLLTLSRDAYAALPFGPFHPVDPIPPNAPKGDYPIPVSAKLAKQQDYARVVANVKTAWWRWHNVRHVWHAVDVDGWPPVVQDGKSWYMGTKIFVREQL